VANLRECTRLIVDLRGHLGGGLGLIRLMSHLTPDKTPIGYSVTRKRAERGFKKESLRRFGWIPSSKLAIPVVALQHAWRDGSVILMTEGLGAGLGWILRCKSRGSGKQPQRQARKQHKTLA